MFQYLHTKLKQQQHNFQLKKYKRSTELAFYTNIWANIGCLKLFHVILGDSVLEISTNRALCIGCLKLEPHDHQLILWKLKSLQQNCLTNAELIVITFTELTKYFLIHSVYHKLRLFVCISAFCSIKKQ